MSVQRLNCGFVPLIDSAPLIIAQDLGIAEDEGIDLNLLTQPSWSALRDLLALGLLDAAHMLSPMPLAMTLGLSGVKAQIDALMVLSVNGNVIGVSTQIADRMRQAGWNGGVLTPELSGRCLMALGDAPLRVGVPFPFSMHRLLFEYWLRHAEPRAAETHRIVTTPPPVMADAVRADELDVFCVGEPWGSVAVDSGSAELILPGSAIWAMAPEKVLAVRRDWATDHDNLVGALMRAVYRAASWLDRTENRALAVEILARSEHLDFPDHTIDHALTGSLVTRLGADPVDVPNFLHFYRGAANFPWRSQAAWIGAQISQLHGLDRDVVIRSAEARMRPDLYRRHLSSLGVDMPGASAKIEGAMRHKTAVASAKGDMILGPDAFFDGAVFDFSDV